MHDDEVPPDQAGMPKEGVESDPRRPRPLMPKFNDPVSWSVAVLRLGGVTIRLHAVMLATILVLMLRSVWFQGESGGVLGPGFSLVLVACVFWVPFFEEMVLVSCVRRLGGAVTEIVLHPLGGLDAFVFPPGWKRQAISALSGLFALAVLTFLIGVSLAIATGSFWSLIPPNPLSLEGLYSIHMLGSWWLSTLFLLQWSCTIVLVANLVPAPPMRGWHILHALLRSRMGWTKSKRVVLWIGVASVVVLAGGGLVAGELGPILLACLCAVCLHEEFAGIQALKAALGHERDDHTMMHAESLIEQEEAASSEVITRLRSARAQTQLKEEEDALDRILAKISSEGRHALDRTERRLLKRATRRRQGGRGD